MRIVLTEEPQEEGYWMGKADTDKLFRDRNHQCHTDWTKAIIILVYKGKEGL